MVALFKVVVMEKMKSDQILGIYFEYRTSGFVNELENERERGCVCQSQFIRAWKNQEFSV